MVQIGQHESIIVSRNPWVLFKNLDQQFTLSMQEPVIPKSVILSWAPPASGIGADLPATESGVFIWEC